MYGGQEEHAFCPGFPLPEVYAFDFATRSWSMPVLPQLLAARSHHMATCHNGTMIVLGGVQVTPVYAMVHFTVSMHQDDYTSCPNE